MPIIVETVGHIAADIQLAVTGISEHLQVLSDVPHDLLMVIYPAEVVTTDDGDACWATFQEPTGNTNLHIKIAGRFPRGMFPHRRDGIENLMDSVCHEFAHYEQWRDGKEITERGVNVRARGLLKLCGLA